MSRRPRRLALNGKWIGQETTGTQRYARELTRALLPLLDERPVLHVPAGAPVPSWAEQDTEVRRSRLSGNLFEQVALPWASRRDLLLSLGGAAPLLARRQVATMHDATPFRLPHTYSRVFATWYRLMYRVVGRGALRILTVSDFSRSELTEVLGVPSDRIVVVPNGVEHADHAEAQRPAAVRDDPFVLMVGPPTAHKNIAPVAAALAEQGVHVVAIGGGGAAHVFGATHDEGTGDAPRGVQRLGRVSDAEVAWLYRHAAVLVFPSLYEGFGLPVVEAQRQGCPVVTSDRASLPEVAGDAAVLVDPTRPDQVAAAVVRLLADPERRSELAEAGRRNAARFRWSASAARLSETLRELG